MRLAPSSVWSSYAVALLCTLLATLVVELFRSTFQSAPFLLFIAAVVVASWYGGFKPGLLVTVLTCLTSAYLLMEPIYSFYISETNDLVRLCLYAVMGAVVSALIGEMHAARQAERDSAASAQAQREQLRVALTSIGDAVIVTDAAGRVTILNAVAETLTGWPPAEAVGRPLQEIFPIFNESTLAPVENPVAKVMLHGTVIGLANHTILRHRDGSERPIDDSAAPIRDEGGAIAGVILVFRDVTEKRRDEREREQLLAREREARTEAERDRNFVRRVLDYAPLAVAVTEGAEQRITFINRTGHELLGLSEADLQGKTPADIVPQATRHVAEVIDRVYRSGVAETIPELRLDVPDGRSLYVQVTYAPLPGRESQPAGVLHLAVDLTARKRAEEALHFLVEASEALASSLDYETTLASVARLVVPRLADWCSVYVVEEGGPPRQLAVAHVDAAKVEWARQLARRYPPDPDAPTGMPQVLRSGQSQLTSEITEEMIVAGARDAEHREIIRSLGLKSAMTVPLNARGRTLGAITFVGAESGQRYGPADLALAEDLARRAAVAVDNARLYREAQDALRRRDETLHQLSLLVEASGSLTRSLELQDVLAAILDLSHRLLAADAYSIWRRRSDPERWEVVQSSGLSEEYLRKAGRIVGGHQQMSDKPLALEDVQQVSSVGDRRQAYCDEGIVSLLAVPLQIHGQVSGTLVFYYHNRHAFDELTVRLATTLANLASSAIGTAELYERESALRQRAEEADRRKDEFLALLGHELRNPLAPLRNAVALLTMRPNDPVVVTQARDMIGRQTAQMTRLVDELLDASRIARGKVQLQRESLNLAALARAAAEDHRAELEAARLTLTIETPTAPLWVLGDAARLTQVIENLLHNAGKFTNPGGAVTLRVNEKDGQAVLGVEDTGIGFAPEALPHLFEAFSQVDATLERSKGGLGLGLSVVRGLIDLHGGRVSAASAGPGRGAVFTVRLPLTEAGETPPPRGEEARSPVESRRRVLIIEDSPDGAESMRLLLTLRGFEVAVAHTGPHGVEQARLFLPHAVVCDLGLPGMSGFEVAKALRAEPSTASTLLICISGYGQEQDRRQASEAGFNHFLVKPAEIAEVQRLLLVGEPNG